MRLIDTDSMKADLLTVDPRYEGMIQWCIAVLDAQPTVEERKTGKWIDMGDFVQCSACLGTRLKEIETMYGKAVWAKTAFCPSCGARMER